jgi:hypothetical protein
MRRQVDIARVQPAEVNQPFDSGALRRGNDVACRLRLLVHEVRPGAHRVHEVVDDVDTVECRGQRVGVAEVAPNHLGTLAPWRVGEFVRVARQRPHLAAPVEQFRRQATADVAGRARDQAANFVVRHARGWPFMRSGKPKPATRLSSSNRAATR